jgi:transposase
VQTRQTSKQVVVQRCDLTSDRKTAPRPPAPAHGQSQYMWTLKIHATRMRLQKHSRRCDTTHDGGFELQSTFFGALQRRAAPENLMRSHQARKTFDGPPSPVPQGECVALNSRMNSKHGYQLAPLLGASVHGPTFFAARARTSAFLSCHEQAFRGTTDERGRH